MKKIILLASVVVASFLTGCAYVPQDATIAPSLNLTPSSVGNDINIAVWVVDERPTQSLGKKGTATGPGAEIRSDQDLAEIVREQLTKGLQAKGFTTATWSPTANARMKVEVRFLEYSTSVGFWTGGVHVNAAIKVVATKSGQVFEHLYRVDEEDRRVFVPGESENERMINDALSSVLQQIVDDSNLIQHLTR